MKVNIFILCFNEEVLLPRTVSFYKTNIPCCQITILDNESTDNSIKIAKKLGCKIISWTSNFKDMIDDIQYRNLKNNCWKSIKDGWIIMIDMDEWLCVSESDLLQERNFGTSILSVQGLNIVGESEKKDLSDIDDLNKLEKYQLYDYESKNLCFLRESIDEMNYTYGAHQCFPKGKRVQYSWKRYYNKHMVFLGLPYYEEKQISRYKRSGEMRLRGLATHYSDSKSKIKKEYEDAFLQSSDLYFIDYYYFYPSFLPLSLIPPSLIPTSLILMIIILFFFFFLVLD